MLFYFINKMNFSKKIISFLVLFFLFKNVGFTHPMPSSMVVLKVNEKNITGEIQLPLGELQSAIGMGVNDNSVGLVERLGDTLRAYLIKHIRPKSFEGKLWTVELSEMHVNSIKNPLTGEYNELIVAFSMAPPLHFDLRNFYFDYDVILHQVASHKILINVKQDWQQGIFAEDSTMQQLGIIELDVPTGKIPVFQVALSQGSTWQGFKSMVTLGMSHIKDGTDHLLFLLVLLLPALQMAQNKRWEGFSGTKESFKKIIKIVTSFTVGHSITLLLGAIGFINFPSKPIEILIAVSITVSAIHAIRPIFNNKEIFIAAGFGLVHGLAFANTLKELGLETSNFILSIFGFNLGVEIFQILIVILVFPILLLLAQKTTKYSLFRTIGAVIAIFASFYWLWERI
jgi:HupE / UreJ protein